MSDRTRLGLAVAEAALVVGLLGDLLLRATPWGLNVFLWTGALVAGAHLLSRRKGARRLSGEGAWLWPVAVLFAGFFVWRDSTTLRLLDTLVILAALALAASGARGVRVRLAGVADYVIAGVVAAFNAAFGVLPLVFSDVKWKEIPRTRWSKHVLAVTRGLLIAIPLLLLFGALLVAADALFEGLVRDTFNFNAGRAFTHVLLFGFFAWIAAGYLRGLLLAGPPITSDVGHTVFTTLNMPKVVHVEPATAGAKPTEGGEAASANVGGGARAGTAETVREDERHIEASARGGYRFSAGDEQGATDEARDDARRTAATHEDAARVEVKATDASTTHDKEAGAARDKEASATSVKDADAKTGASVFALKSTMRERVSLGIVEVGVVLGLIDLLFLSFVAVQLRYFFGDARHVITSAGLTFSDYARRGFFELVWVALLALPMLLAAHWLLRKDHPRNERIFRGLAGVMVALLFAVMASGLWRMRLYQQAYGQTELRFYTTAFMLWLGVVFVWFALTVLRGRRERFACGALVVWLVALAALHAVNPDDMIVRTNVAQAQSLQRPERFDSEYATSISADAVPALVELLNEMSPGDRAHVASQLTSWLEPSRTGDWRSWNFARARARRVVAENEPALREWEARRLAELKLLSKSASAPPPARTKSETALAVLPGSALSLRVERRPLETSPAWFTRTVSLGSGEMVVSVVQLSNDNGANARISVYKLSDTLYLLQDANNAKYVADLARRVLIRHDANADFKTAGLVGAFNLDANNVWRFVPASEEPPPQPVARTTVSAAPAGGK